MGKKDKSAQRLHEQRSIMEQLAEYQKKQAMFDNEIGVADVNPGGTAEGLSKRKKHKAMSLSSRLGVI